MHAGRDLEVMRSWRDAVLAAIAVALVVAAVLSALVIRTAVTRPLEALAAACRRITDGDFGEKIVPQGPKDIRAIAADVEDMRQRIVDELEATQSARSQLADQALELQRSNAELEQFAYVASHDLQEPLRKVASFCQLIEKRYGDKLDERGTEYIAFAVDGAKRMQILINDLLTFSRVGRLNPARDDVDLGATLDDALENLDTAITESGAEIVRESPLPRIKGDPTLLTMVWQNLIGNAVKFKRDGVTPRIVVDCEQSPDEPGGPWQLTVTDNGIGIPEEFVRQGVRDLSAPSRTRRLHRHRHRPCAVQEDHRTPWRQHLDRQLLHRGYQVSLHDSRYCRRPHRSQSGRAILMTPAGRAIDVLLIEDDPGDEVITREAFEHNKIKNNLHVAHDGEEGLDFLYQRGAFKDAPRPDLVLLDLNLPKYDGRQLLEQIKSDPELSHIPVVVLTTSSAEEDILRSYKLHANAYVTKPVDLDQFMEAVRQIDEFFVQVVRLPPP